MVKKKSSVLVYLTQINPPKIIRRGNIYKNKNGNWMTMRFTNAISKLDFSKGQEYKLKVSYGFDPDNVNYGVFGTKEDIVTAWSAIASADTLDFLSTDDTKPIN